MRSLYLDPVGGLAGDMLLAALLDTGIDETEVRARLASLPLRGCRIEFVTEVRRGFRGRRVRIDFDGDQPSRRLGDVLDVVRGGDLPGGAVDRAVKIFNALADAEGTVHGLDSAEVHFHEVGAVDSILDVAGISLALELASIGEVRCGPLPMARGTTRGAHGEFPLPAPATASLLDGWPVRFTDREAECVTPTGAAVLAALGTPGPPIGPVRMGRVGIGFGSRQDESGPVNMVRAFRLEADEATGLVDVVESTLDDMNAEWVPVLIDRLFEAGALDVFTQPVQMKKGRGGVLVTALADAGGADRIAEIFFTHSTTLGVRIRRDERRELERRVERVDTPLGPVRLKVARRPDGSETGAPEFEDCREIAERRGVPLLEVYRAAEAVWAQRDDR